MLKLVTLTVFAVVANAAQLQPYGNDQVTPKPIAGDQMDPCSIQLAECLSPMMPEGGEFSLGGPASWTTAELKQRCQTFKTVEECITVNMTGLCHDDVEVQAKAFVSTLNFICKDVFDEIIQLSGCTGSPKTQKDVQNCVQNLAHTQASLLNTDNSDNEQAAQCRVLAAYEECVVGVEGDDCGEEAEALYVRIFDQMNRIILEQINCSAVMDGDSSSDDSGSDEILEPTYDEKCVPVVSQCLQQLETHKQSMVEFDINDLPSICRDYRTATTCMENAAIECEGSPQWQMLEESFTRICNPDALKALTTRDVCFRKPSLNTKLENCEKEELKEEEETDETQTCQVLEEYLNCYNVAVQEECPTEIAKAMQTILEGVGGIIEMEKSLNCEDEEEMMLGEESVDDEDKTSNVDDQACPEAIARCLQPLEPHRKSFTTFQLETIPLVCSDFQSVQTCMAVSAGRCASTPEWGIIVEAFSQICAPAYKEGIPDCPVRQDVVTKLKSCEKEDLKADVLLDDSKTCRFIQDYVNCFTITVERECEEQDGRLVSKVMTGVAQVIQLDKEVLCDSDDDDVQESSEEDVQMPTAKPMINDEVEKQMTLTWGPLRKCLGGLSDIHHTLIPIENFDNVDELCHRFVQVDICGSDNAKGLSNELRERWDALMSVYQYVCTEKRQEFRETYPCLARHFRSGQMAEVCYQPLFDDENMETGMCRKVEDFEECSLKACIDACGHEAGKLAKGLMERANSLLSVSFDIDCPFFGHWSTYKKIAVGVGIGVPLLIIALVCACVMTKRRCRQRSETLDKKQLVKNDILASVQIGGGKDSKNDGIATLSVSQIEI